MILLGPFKQLLPMTGVPTKGPVSDDSLLVVQDAGLVLDGAAIKAVGKFSTLKTTFAAAEIHELQGNYTCLPGIIDAHTHICFGGSRARDYALRNAGKTYLEIAKAGGGIWDTVQQTRKASKDALVQSTVTLANRHLKNGTTTLEVKSGYGLSVSEELKLLRAIQEADSITAADLISTCLAAHMLPKDFSGDAADYLAEIAHRLFPILREEKLTQRIDAFIEESAFSEEQIVPYFQKAREMGFDITVHADQFSTGGSAVAVAYDAISADHLEASTATEIALLAQSEVIAVALPGASLGLGCGFTPARQLLDAGGALAIASDHNPGSAPMGDLLTQAAILGSFEKLSNAEVLAGISCRAAAALNLKDRGQLKAGLLADFILFPTGDYKEILYNQGSLKPCAVFKKGTSVLNHDL